MSLILAGAVQRGASKRESGNLVKIDHFFKAE